MGLPVTGHTCRPPLLTTMALKGVLLKLKFRSELHHARPAHCVSDAAEVGTAQFRIRRCKVCPVEDVEDVPAELCREAFRKFCSLDDSQVQTRLRWRAQSVSRQVPVLTKGGAQGAAIKGSFSDIGALNGYVATEIWPSETKPIETARATDQVGVLRRSLNFWLGREDAVWRAGLCLEKS